MNIEEDIKALQQQRKRRKRSNKNFKRNFKRSRESRGIKYERYKI